jgi:hypothetical protein
MALPQQTGVLVVSPDGSTPLYSALYDGDALASIASAARHRAGSIWRMKHLVLNVRSETG